jgi:hypothetical protein
MKRPKLLVACLLFGVLLAACGPSITVTNNTKFPIRAVVTTSSGSDVVSPTPGNSSAVDADVGNYTVTAIPDADWVAYAQSVRQFLNDQLAHSDSLTGPQLLQVVQRLKDIAKQMQQFQAAAGKGSSCTGAITENGGGTVNVGQAADGSLVVSC